MLTKDCSLVGGRNGGNAGDVSKGEYDLAGFAVGVVEQDKNHYGKRDPSQRHNDFRSCFIRHSQQWIFAGAKAVLKSAAIK